MPIRFRDFCTWRTLVFAGISLSSTTFAGLLMGLKWNRCLIGEVSDFISIIRDIRIEVEVEILEIYNQRNLHWYSPLVTWASGCHATFWGIYSGNEMQISETIYIRWSMKYNCFNWLITWFKSQSQLLQCLYRIIDYTFTMTSEVIQTNRAVTYNDEPSETNLQK